MLSNASSRASEFRYSLESSVYERRNERLRDEVRNFALNKIPQMLGEGSIESWVS